MNKPVNIAKQIEKYLNGELDARAMHQLEREAQNDPFLMDALEGYGKAGVNQQANLNDIAGRLQQRTAKGKVRSMLIWRLSAAASVIVLLGAIGLWLFNDKPAIDDKALTKQVEIVTSPERMAEVNAGKADSALQQVAEKPTTSQSPYIAGVKPKQLSARKKKQPTELVLDAPPVANEIAADKLQEKIAVDYFAQKAKPVTDTVVKVRQHALTNTLAGRVAGVAISKNSPRYKTITGKVTDGTAPLPGVTVQGTNSTTVTDIDGEFSLTIPEKSTVNFGYIGYESKKVKVKNQDSLLIAMVPSQNSLSEVVVVNKNDNARKIKEAHPINGWDDYNEYLKDNAISPDGKKGTVKLTFAVNPDGSLTEFEIIKSLSDEIDQQAIALVKDGPKWMADVSGQPKKVKLSIKFRSE